MTQLISTHDFVDKEGMPVSPVLGKIFEYDYFGEKNNYVLTGFSFSPTRFNLSVNSFLGWELWVMAIREDVFPSYLSLYEPERAVRQTPRNIGYIEVKENIFGHDKHVLHMNVNSVALTTTQIQIHDLARCNFPWPYLNALTDGGCCSLGTAVTGKGANDIPPTFISAGELGYEGGANIVRLAIRPFDPEVAEKQKEVALYLNQVLQMMPFNNTHMSPLGVVKNMIGKERPLYTNKFIPTPLLQKRLPPQSPFGQNNFV